MNIKRIKWFGLNCLIFMVLVITGCTKEWPEAPTPTTRPEVVSVSPGEWELMVAPGANISITFSVDMDLESIKDLSSVTDADGNEVAGSWSSSGETVIFDPSSNLSTLSHYGVTIEGAFDEDQEWKGAGARDVYGNSLYEDYTTHFTTEGDYGASPIYFGPGPNYGEPNTVGRLVDFEVEILEGFEGAQGIALNSDGSRLYVADRGGNAVMAVDAADFSISTTIALADTIEEPWIVGIKPDDSEAWVLCRGTNHLVIVETAGNTISHVLPLNDYCPDGGFLYRILFNDDGSKAYVSTRLSKSVLRINTATYAVEYEKVVDVVEHIQDFGISADDSKLYLGNTWGSEPSIVIVDAKSTMDDLGTIDLPDEWGDAKKMATFDNYLYVALRWMGIVYKIDMTTDEVVATGWAGSEPEEICLEGLAVDPSGAVVYSIATDEEMTAMFRADDLTFIGYIESGSWWQIVTQKP